MTTTNENKSFEIQTEEALLSVATAQVKTTSAAGVKDSKEIAIVATIGDKSVPLFLNKEQATELVNALNQLIKQL